MKLAALQSLPSPSQLCELVESFRIDASRRLSPQQKSEKGQFLTPSATARFMASLPEAKSEVIHILDAGAGIGALSAHAISTLCTRRRRPKRILVTAYEIDDELADYLAETYKACEATCLEAGVDFRATIYRCDFLEAATSIINHSLFAEEAETPFNYAILNPPYFKIHTGSRERLLLRQIGVETTNIYAGFLAATSQLLAPEGELVAITPRSFCNGTYFRPFRKLFLAAMQLRRLHLFDSRTITFQDDDVLQENLIFHAVKSSSKPPAVTISSSTGPSDNSLSVRTTPYELVVNPDDDEAVIHIPTDERAAHVTETFTIFTSTLNDLEINVSTGRVVDFRAREHLRNQPSKSTVPLIYPSSCRDGFVSWPVDNSRKPSAILKHPETESLLVPAEHYVLVKRFTAKEEKRRVVAALADPARFDASQLGIENHLNYFHHNGRGLDEQLARGLTIFLNSSLLDHYFRQFSGHTQVNATDLRRMKYPSAQALRRLAAAAGDNLANQATVDALVTSQLLNSAPRGSLNPQSPMSKTDEALAILKLLGFPRAQQNERSALSLLALLDLKPETPWSGAAAPLRGITQMMDFFREHYGKVYAPNSRETVRRQTVHQFVAAGLIVPNPDDPARPINSGKTVYQIEAAALTMLKTYGTSSWARALRKYLAAVETLAKRYAQQRDMQLIPVVMAGGQTLNLSPGGQNVLVKLILEQFCPRYTPGGEILYVGDTGDKFAYFNAELLNRLGVSFDSHGKMPDVIVHYTERNWLILIEAVTSHGPVDSKRHAELKTMFANSHAGLVYVTAFPDRKIMARYLGHISWETEVWVAEAPDHLIHFNGERFLGPY